MDESEVVDELYALAPGDFTRVRNERAADARGAGDAALAARIRQLRRPTASAWALNQLARQYPDEIAALLAVGARLREAQTTLAGEALRELGKQRRQVVAALARQARAVAVRSGQRLSASAESEVEDTLNAALVDPSAGYALRSGRLTHPLSYVGLGPLSAASGAEPAEPPPPPPRPVAPVQAGGTVGGEPAEPPPGAGPLLWPVLDDSGGPDQASAASGARSNGKPALVEVRSQELDRTRELERARRRRAEQERLEAEEARRRRELDQARTERQLAETAAAEAARKLRDAQARAEDVTARRRELDARVDQLHEQLRQAEEEAMQAAKDVLDARHARDSAARQDLVARRLAERARAEVERLDS